MFTGIIEEVGKLSSKEAGRIKISCEKVLEGVEIGDSINTNGICLTVVEKGADYFKADVMPETIRKTSLSELKKGAKINLERALKVGDRLNGHIVSGHIDGCGKILSIKAEGNAIMLEITAESRIMRQIAEKGSVAIDGISLTVVKTNSESFYVSLIPHTMAETNLEDKKIGSIVNIETDILAKYVERQLKFRETTALTRNFLEEQGFL